MNCQTEKSSTSDRDPLFGFFCGASGRYRPFFGRKKGVKKEIDRPGGNVCERRVWLVVGEGRDARLGVRCHPRGPAALMG